MTGKTRTHDPAPERRALTFLQRAPLERRRGGWRFGAASIGDIVVERLVENGKARITGDRVELVAAASPFQKVDGGAS